MNEAGYGLSLTLLTRPVYTQIDPFIARAGEIWLSLEPDLHLTCNLGFVWIEVVSWAEPNQTCCIVLYQTLDWTGLGFFPLPPPPHNVLILCFCLCPWKNESAVLLALNKFVLRQTSYSEIPSGSLPFIYYMYSHMYHYICNKDVVTSTILQWSYHKGPSPNTGFNPWGPCWDLTRPLSSYYTKLCSNGMRLDPLKWVIIFLMSSSLCNIDLELLWLILW